MNSRIDHLEAAQAFTALSRQDDDPRGLTRRRFLQGVALGLGGAAVLSAAEAALVPTLLPGYLQEAWAAPPVGEHEGILVVLFMYGGNDGLNTLVPYNNSAYYGYRGGLAIPGDQVLALDGSVGLHPNLGYLKQMYDDGRVAVIQGVGYSNPDLSHFSSQAIWMAGHSSGQAPTGWIGRWLDGFASDDAFRAASIGTSVPLQMIGNSRRATGISDDDRVFGAEGGGQNARVYDGVRAFSTSASGRGPWHDAIAAVERTQLQVAATTAPMFAQPLADGPIAGRLTLAARLINANLGFRVLDVGWGDFDSHSDQPGMHPARLGELDAGLRAFFTNLDDAYRSRTSVLVISEFGRSPWLNGSNGTDHGTSSVSFLIGHSVRGGLHGQYSSLANIGRWDQMQPQVDFRQIYSNVLGTWLGADANAVLGGAYAGLSLFSSGPGAELPEAAAPPYIAGDYVPLSPFRVLDTRNNIGGRRAPMGAGTTVEIPAMGVGGVPTSGVAAVALNVTATGTTSTSYFTIWPKGEPRPYVSSLNWTAGQTVPNLVVMKPGTGGKINVWSESGEAHAIADVVGYFRDTSADRLLPMSPSRVLDTRAGTGVPAGKVGAGGSITVQMTGVAGIPAGGVDAVVLNVTVDQPDQGSYLTIWPSDEGRPNASSLNYSAGQTVPNLVIAKLSAAGQVSFYNAFGNVHVVADVVGCFTSGAQGRHHAVSPARILDTRTNIAIAGAIGTDPVRLQVAGQGGVPSSGATGVVLNMTVTGAQTRQASYLTVWPAGEAKPYVSSLNYGDGQTVANLVIVKLGADGAVDVANAFGSTHLIADVVGYFD